MAYCENLPWLFKADGTTVQYPRRQAAHRESKRITNQVDSFGELFLFLICVKIHNINFCFVSIVMII